MSKRDGQQQGPQDHAEGQHGAKDRAAFIDELHSGADKNHADAAAPTENGEADEYGRPLTGHHRLQEDRQQHDEAEKNSEANRRRR